MPIPSFESTRSGPWTGSPAMASARSRRSAPERNRRLIQPQRLDQRQTERAARGQRYFLALGGKHGAGACGAADQKTLAGAALASGDRADDAPGGGAAA